MKSSAFSFFAVRNLFASIPSKVSAKIAKSKSHKEQGFTLIELLIVMAIIAVLSLFAVPAMRGFIISGKVEPNAKDVSSIVAKIRGNYAGQGSAPYNGSTPITSAIFAGTAKGVVSALSLDGGGVISHDIGGTNSPLLVVPSSVGGTGTVLGDSYTVTFNSVNDSACPGLSAQLSKAADKITVNGTTVKDPTATTPKYDSGLAQSKCTDGDTNTFIFTFR